MRQFLSALILSLAVVLLPGCAKDPPPMVGGLADATKTAEARQAAGFAVRQQSARTGEALKLAGLLQAEQQVVGGINYRMTLQVKSAGDLRMAHAVVYRSPAPQMMLTSWEWVEQ